MSQNYTNNDEDKSIKNIGAAWIKERNGRKYTFARIVLDKKAIGLRILRNKFKEPNTNQPDWLIYLAFIEDAKEKEFVKKTEKSKETKTPTKTAKKVSPKVSEPSENSSQDTEEDEVNPVL